ncbi:MAG: protein-export chaperone SecB [Syntrophaceae bacterium]|nr:protein-export chaperone SecB [Syntrophaceae bacterium]
MKKSSTLQLEEFFITKLNVEYIEGSKNKTEDSTTYNLTMDYDVARHADNSNLFKLDFKVNNKPKRGQAGLAVNAELSGFFSFPEGTEEDEMQYLARVNGCSMLYSLLRGQIAMVSGSFPGGKLNMPAIVIQDQIRKIEEKKQKLLHG